MEFTDQFEKIDRLLYDLKHKSYVVEIIIDEKLEPIRGREIDEDDQDGEAEVWESFLTHFYNCLNHFKELNYYQPDRFPPPELTELNVDVSTTNFKFFVGKYDLLLGLMGTLQVEVLKLSDVLVADHPFQVWKAEVMEKIEEFSENAEYIHEHK